MGELEKPRERCTPYAFFLNVCREQWNKQNPEEIVDFNTISNICWPKWNSMSDFQKKRFVKLAESDEQRYTRAMEKYNEAKKVRDEERRAEKKEKKQKINEEKKAERIKLNEEKKAEKRKLIEEKKAAKLKKKKDPNAPKNARNAYMFFCNELREKLKSESPDMPITEVGKEAGRRWKEMTPSIRAKYEKMAADDKLRYEKEKSEYDSGTQTIPALLQKSGATPSKQIEKTNSTNATKESSSSSSDSDDDDGETFTTLIPKAFAASQGKTPQKAKKDESSSSDSSDSDSD